MNYPSNKEDWVVEANKPIRNGKKEVCRNYEFNVDEQFVEANKLLKRN